VQRHRVSIGGIGGGGCGINRSKLGSIRRGNVGVGIQRVGTDNTRRCRCDARRGRNGSLGTMRVNQTLAITAFGAASHSSRSSGVRRSATIRTSCRGMLSDRGAEHSRRDRGRSDRRRSRTRRRKTMAGTTSSGTEGRGVRRAIRRGERSRGAGRTSRAGSSRRANRGPGFGSWGRCALTTQTNEMKTTSKQHQDIKCKSQHTYHDCRAASRGKGCSITTAAAAAAAAPIWQHPVQRIHPTVISTTVLPTLMIVSVSMSCGSRRGMNRLLHDRAPADDVLVLA